MSAMEYRVKANKVNEYKELEQNQFVLFSKYHDFLIEMCRKPNLVGKLKVIKHMSKQDS